MADVRALLRAERAAREPASAKRSAAPSPVAPHEPSKKRKSPTEAVSNGEHAQKRARENREAHLLEEERHADDALDGGVAQTEQMTTDTQLSTAAALSDANQAASADVDVDEDEWAAFERDLATPPPPPPATTAIATAPSSAIHALHANATISAAPTTTTTTTSNAAGGTELDRRKQREEEQRAQRARREEELVADKEDAVSKLEDEFEEMEALEARVRRLRERREALRGAEDGTKEVEQEKIEPVDVDESSDEEEDDDDVWAFGRR